MNFHIDIQQQYITTTCLEAMPSEQELFLKWGFNAQEIASLLWLSQWYQTGCNDRAAMLRSFKFLLLLVHSGELELS